MKTRKCAYNQCKHGGIINLDEDLYEKEGTRYYHASCLKDRNNVALIRNLWKTRISRTVSFGLLNKVVNQIVEDTGVSTDYILFTVQQIISRKLTINHPFGLKYYIDDGKIKEAYKAKVRKRIKQSDFQDTERKESKQFTYNPIVEKGFKGIFGGE